MKIHDAQHEGSVILAPSGRVDSNSSPELERVLVAHAGSGATRIVVDLAEVEYISSAGLRVLLMVARKLQDAKGRLVLCAMPESVRLVFELAGFLPIFAIEPTREAALFRLAESGA